jgi:hypothetical protein
MPKKQQHHYGVCEHCEGTGIKQFFKKVGNFLKPGKALKPIVRPLANELIHTGAEALTGIAPEYAPAMNYIGERVLSNSVDKGLASKGYGVKRQGRFAKGSQEAKDHMAKIRAMRGKGVGGKNGMYVPQPHSRMP